MSPWYLENASVFILFICFRTVFMEYAPPQFPYFYLENLKLIGIPEICHMICPCEKARMIPTELLRELEGDH